MKKFVTTILISTLFASTAYAVSNADVAKWKQEGTWHPTQHTKPTIFTKGSALNKSAYQSIKLQYALEVANDIVAPRKISLDNKRKESAAIVNVIMNGGNPDDLLKTYPAGRIHNIGNPNRPAINIQEQEQEAQENLARQAEEARLQRIRNAVREAGRRYTRRLLDLSDEETAADVAAGEATTFGLVTSILSTIGIE